MALVLWYIPIIIQEETLKGQSGWEHLNEPLHVVIEVEMEEDEAIKAVSIEKDLLTKLMSPDVRHKPIFFTYEFIEWTRPRKSETIKTISINQIQRTNREG